MGSNLNALIVDDESHCQEMLASLLQRHCPEVTVVGIASSAADARALITSTRPHVVFLDIAMPGESGFDLLQSIAERDFQVVFVTAYEQFAVRAFRASALDYLLKPVSDVDLRESVDKVVAHYRTEPVPAHHDHSLAELYRSLQTKRLDRITIPKQNGIDVLELQDIQYLEADINYTRFHLHGDRRVVACNTLGHFEEILEPEGFFRVHRSYLINLRHLQAYQQSPVSEAILKTGVRLEVSRRRAALFNEAVRKWRGL